MGPAPHINPKQKRRCCQRRSWCKSGPGPLRLTPTGATRSGTAGVGRLIAVQGKSYAHPSAALFKALRSLLTSHSNAESALAVR